MKKLLIILFVLVLPGIVNAEIGAKRETVEQLLITMKVDDMLDSMYSQMDQIYMGMAKKLGVKESEQHIFDKFMSNTATAMKEEMTWEKMKEPMIDLYLKHYSQKEINDMLAFYSTESGKSIINKMPIVMKDAMLISQQMLSDFMPKLKELSAELRRNLEKERKKAL